MTYRIRFTREAAEDLERLYDFVLERELCREGDLELATRAIEAHRERHSGPERFTRLLVARPASTRSSGSW